MQSKKKRRRGRDSREVVFLCNKLTKEATCVSQYLLDSQEQLLFPYELDNVSGLCSWQLVSERVADLNLHVSGRYFVELRYLALRVCLSVWMRVACSLP